MSLFGDVGSGAAAGSSFGPWGAVIGGAAGLAKGLLGNSAAKKKNRLLGQGIDEQAAFGREGGRDVNNAVTTLGASRPDIAGSRGQFMTSLRGLPQISGPITASRAFKGGAAASNAGAAGYGGNMADLFARIRAPQTQSVNDSVMLGHLGTDLDAVSRRAASADFINKLKVGKVQENPWLSLGTDVLRNVGKYGMTNGFGSGNINPVTISGPAANGGYKYP